MQASFPANFTQPRPISTGTPAVTFRPRSSCTRGAIRLWKFPVYRGRARPGGPGWAKPSTSRPKDDSACGAWASKVTWTWRITGVLPSQRDSYAGRGRAAGGPGTGGGSARGGCAAPDRPWACRGRGSFLPTGTRSPALARLRFRGRRRNLGDCDFARTVLIMMSKGRGTTFTPPRPPRSAARPRKPSWRSQCSLSRRRRLQPATSAPKVSAANDGILKDTSGGMCRSSRRTPPMGGLTGRGSARCVGQRDEQLLVRHHGQ